MRLLCTAMGAVWFALPASAAMSEGKDWRTCTADSECVLIQGTCRETAVNIAYQAEASAYYQQQAKGADCPKRFWEAKTKIAECQPKFGPGGSKAGSCEAVAKPIK